MSIWDFSERILLSSDGSVNKSVLDSSFLVTSKKTNNENTQVLEMYNAFDVPEPQKEKKSTEQVAKKIGLTDEQMRNQKGKLNKFFVGDFNYILSGVFFDQARFAVLLQTNIKTNKVEEIKLLQGDLVGEYLVKQISENKIVFTESDRKIELSIF